MWHLKTSSSKSRWRCQEDRGLTLCMRRPVHGRWRCRICPKHCRLRRFIRLLRTVVVMADLGMATLRADGGAFGNGAGESGAFEASAAGGTVGAGGSGC